MALTIPNLPDIVKRDPKTAEALQKIQQFVNQNTVLVAGNKVAPPPFVTPGSPGG
jgi:hypothetical protein